MPDEPIKTRFAPSPSGFLHLGNVRTALFNWLYARHCKGVFLLRIEDTDEARTSEAAVNALIEDLHWLALSWDEGQGGGGTAGPYRQSERGAIYQEYFSKLESAGLAYPCFCSPPQLSLARKQQLARGLAPRYAGTCRHLSPAEVQRRRAAGGASSLRFHVEPGRSLEFADRVRGPQRFATDDIGDFVIRRSDGSPAFFFSNVLDDALMGVTDVLRGEDHLSNTPRQLLILAALGLPGPRYAHIGLVTDADGSPLSKRAGSLAVRELRAQGVLPIAVHNTLGRLGHRYEEPGFLGPDALIARFDIRRIGRAPARFDPVQLKHWQREAVAQLEPKAFWDWLSAGTRRTVPETARDAFIEAIRTNVSLPGETGAWAGILFDDAMLIAADAEAAIAAAGPEFFQHALQALAAAPEQFDHFLAALKQASGKKGPRLFAPLRAAITGRMDGPELKTLIPLIGPARLAQRLAAAQHLQHAEHL
ncbi:MAG: glutamate--tRNA ligase [Gammaproteobacteria bacterium]